MAQPQPVRTRSKVSHTFDMLERLWRVSKDGPRKGVQRALHTRYVEPRPRNPRNPKRHCRSLPSRLRCFVRPRA